MFRIKNIEDKEEKIIDVFLTKTPKGDVTLTLQDSTGRLLNIARLYKNGKFSQNVFPGEIEEMVTGERNNIYYEEEDEEDA